MYPIFLCRLQNLPVLVRRSTPGMSESHLTDVCQNGHIAERTEPRVKESWTHLKSLPIGHQYEAALTHCIAFLTRSGFVPMGHGFPLDYDVPMGLTISE